MDSKTHCSVEGCENYVRSSGLCSAHYRRLWRHGSATSGRVSPGSRQKWIKEHLDYTGEECLMWPFSTVRGYGATSKNGKTTYINRLMCEHRNGPPPSPLHQAAHNCGNRGCVNPSHIRWATRKENESDKELHGTRPKGTGIRTSKLSEDDVRAIRSSGLTNTELAKIYGVDQSNISVIRTRKKWAWVE